MAFGERLRELREERKMTQADLAKLLSLSKQQISNYERGVHFPRDEKILKVIANHFNVSMDYLMGMVKVRNYHEVYQDFLLYSSLNEAHRNMIRKNMDFLKREEAE